MRRTRDQDQDQGRQPLTDANRPLWDDDNRLRVESHAKQENGTGTEQTDVRWRGGQRARDATKSEGVNPEEELKRTYSVSILLRVYLQKLSKTKRGNIEMKKIQTYT